MWEDLRNIKDLKEFKSKISGKISDGSHSFEELYYHRMILFSVICDAYKEKSWRSKLHSDGKIHEGYFIVGIDTEEGQYSYHYKLEYWDYFEGIKELEKAPVWDKHISKDVNRLLSLKANK